MFGGGFRFASAGPGGGAHFFPGGMPGMGGMPGGMPGRGGGEDKEVDTAALYEALGIEKDASASQIKKAYLKLARKEHPDKGGDPEKFKTIQHAYDILGDEDKRRLYDEGGEEAVESGGAGGGPEDIFSMFFGGGRRGPTGPQKGEPTVHPLKVSLEDLYKGKTLRLAVPKTVYEKDPSGSIMDNRGNRYSKTVQRKVLTVNVDKGMREGQKITFEGEGDVVPGRLPGDVIFVVKSKEHPVFQRKGADLVMKKKITLYEALTGVTFVVNHLDGHQVLVTSKPGEVIQPEQVKQVKDEGMPVAGSSFVKGCLYVAFDVQFPETLDLSDGMKRALGGMLPAPSGPAPEYEDGMDEGVLEEVDMEARKQRERIGQDATYDSDEEGGPGMQRVQCAHQ